MITSLIICLSMCSLTLSYNNDANSDWTSATLGPARSDAGDDTALISVSGSMLSMNMAEYSIWMVYTILTVLILFYCSFRARHVVTYVLRRGLRGLRGIDVEIRFHYESGTTTINLGGRLQDQDIGAAVTVVSDSAVSGAHTAQPVESVSCSDEQYHSCSEN